MNRIELQKLTHCQKEQIKNVAFALVKLAAFAVGTGAVISKIDSHHR